MTISYDAFITQSLPYSRYVYADPTQLKPYKSILDKVNHPSNHKLTANKTDQEIKGIIHKFIDNPQAPSDDTCRLLENKIKSYVKTFQLEMDTKFEKLQKEAYRIYLASATSTLALKILGPSELRSDEILLNNFGTLRIPSQSDGHTAQQNSAGGVIHFNSWNILNNDAAILGAIHTNQPVHVTYSFDELLGMQGEDLYRGDNLRVLIREILQLKAAGYAAINSASLPNTALVSTDEHKTASFTMEHLLDAVKDIRSSQLAQEALHSYPTIDYTLYSRSC